MTFKTWWGNQNKNKSNKKKGKIYLYIPVCTLYVGLPLSLNEELEKLYVVLQDSQFKMEHAESEVFAPSTRFVFILWKF